MDFPRPRSVRPRKNCRPGSGADQEERLHDRGHRAGQPANPGPVAEFRGGKEGAFNFLIGQVMKATRGKANPQLVNEYLRKALQGS